VEALELEPAVAFVSRLAQVAVRRHGQRVGYNGTYVVEAEEQRIGIVAAGYNDGVPWRSSNRGEVLVHGRRVRVLGRVSMDSMAIDLDPVPDAGVVVTHQAPALVCEAMSVRPSPLKSPETVFTHVEPAGRVARGDVVKLVPVERLTTRSFPATPRSEVRS
jgi:hypothetical protein